MMDGARFEPRDPDYVERVRTSFTRQGVMRAFGATLGQIAPGEVQIILPYRDDLTQHDGFLHAGVISTIADSACGYAALTLMAPGANVLSIEYKVNFLAPATGARMVARGRVIRPGRTVTVCYGEVVALPADAPIPTGEEPAGQESAGKLVSTMMATMMAIVPQR